MMWDLPMEAEVSGDTYKIATDYRDIFEIISYLQSDEDEETKSLVALNLFYDDFDSIPAADMQEAADYFSSFVNCFEDLDNTPKPKSIDWEQDYNIISAEVNKVAGCEIRLLPYLHWFTFIGYFYSIGEGQLSYITSIRHKLRKGKKLEKHEQEFYNENKNKIDFKKDQEVQTELSEKEKEFWELFGK